MSSRNPRSTSKKFPAPSHSRPGSQGFGLFLFPRTVVPCFPVSPLGARDSPLIIADLRRLVLETLEPLPGDRKCFRLINGVLVERTVQDVVPALKTNAEGLSKVLDDLVKQYKSKQDELEKWKVRVFAASFYACNVIMRFALGV